MNRVRSLLYTSGHIQLSWFLETVCIRSRVFLCGYLHINWQPHLLSCKHHEQYNSFHTAFQAALLDSLLFEVVGDHPLRMRLLDVSIFCWPPDFMYFMQKPPDFSKTIQTHSYIHRQAFAESGQWPNTMLFPLLCWSPSIKTLSVFYVTSYLVCLFVLFFQYGHVFFQNFHNLSRIFVRFTKQRHGLSSPGFLPSG